VLCADEDHAVEEAVQVLRAGGLVAFPTDTVYGVGASIEMTRSVADLYAAKERPLTMAIPLLCGSAEDAWAYARDVPGLALALAKRFWPGGLTLVVRRGSRVPDVVTAGGDTVAVRLPDHAVARALAHGAGGVLVATSANLSGRPSPVTAADVLADLDGRVDLLLDGGPCPGGVESTIVDVTGPDMRVLREGAISRRRLEAFTDGLIGSSHSTRMLHDPMDSSS
jgi:L-threonylcarbamoyladenylate synthase